MHKTKHRDGNLGLLGHLLATVILFGATVFALNAVTGRWRPKTDFEVGATIVFFATAAIGNLWMFRDLAREKASPTYFLVGLAPYAFIWYYLDRVRMRNRQVR
jgi:hypothetical protein